MLIRPRSQIILITVPSFSGIVENSLVKQVKFTIYNFISFRIYFDFFSVFARGKCAPTTISSTPAQTP